MRNSILACVLGAVMSLYGRSALAQTSTTTSTATTAPPSSTTTAPPSTTTTTIPGSCCGPATCGMVINVDASNNGKTLFLAASDPILSAPCSGNGITVINKGRNAVNQSFTIDCQTNQSNPITGGPTGIGIMLKGVNLSVFNCYVDGFGTGMASNGDGSDIEDSQVQNASGDGFYVKSRVKITNLNIIGVTFTGNGAFSNGGWGFNMPANEIFSGTGTTFNNIADTNGKGGFYVKGDGNALSGNEAFNNGGPGFLIISKSCCSGSSGQSFDTATASSNVGPGIVYEARDDGSNCVGGSGPSCTGGTFYPTGFDTTPGGINAADNGPCPPGSLPFQNGNGVCPIVLRAPCSQAVLNRCP